MQINVLLKFKMEWLHKKQKASDLCSTEATRSHKKIRLLCPFSEATQRTTKLKITDYSYEFSFLGVYKYLRYFCFGLCLTFTQPCAEGIYKISSSKMPL